MNKREYLKIAAEIGSLENNDIEKMFKRMDQRQRLIERALIFGIILLCVLAL